MKNLTRVLSLVLVLTMMVSSVAFAGTFTDIEEGSAYAEATSVLADLGILYGYEDGSFGADKVITRAEVVAVVNRLQGLSDAAKAAGGATAYTDVPADAWYAGDVNLATQMGIITGDGNGLFRPDDQVKYEEAVKMMVAACGYNASYALSRGGWPTGYLVIATEQGLTKGLAESAGSPAYRGIVAKLAYQALTTPMMVLKTYETSGVSNYAPDATTILLEKALGIYKLSGYVSATPSSSLDNAGNAEDGKVNYTLTAEKVGMAMSKTELNPNGAGVINGLLVGDTDVVNTLGLSTDIYVEENEDGKFEIIAYVLKLAKNNIVTLTSDIQAVGAGAKDSKFDATGKYLSVYNEDTDTTNKTYILEDDAVVLLNGAYYKPFANATADYVKSINGSAEAALGYVYAPTNGKVELIDIDNNGKYDFVKTTAYETVIMDDEPYANNTKISTTAGSIDLDFEDKENASLVLTIDGEAATVADLKKDDVLSICKTDAYNYEIKASRATVSGQVTECDLTGTVYEYQFVVDGTTYVLANIVDTSVTDIAKVNAGVEGIFYLDAFGKIAKFEATSASSQNYGFIVAAGEYASVGDKSYEVKILDKEGNTNTYTLAENMKLDDVAGKTALDAYNAIKGLAAYVKGTDTLAWTFKTATGYAAIANDATEMTDAQKAANYANRIITYKLNSNNEVSVIDFVGSTGDLALAGAPASKEYNAKAGVFKASYAVDADAVIFNLPVGQTADKFGISTAATLENEEVYDVAFYNVEENVAKALVITNVAVSVGADQNLAIVTKCMIASNANGDTIYNISFFQAGEEKTLATTEDVATALGNVLAKGTIFEYSVDADGAIDAIAFNSADGDVLTVAELKADPTMFAASFNDAGAKVQFVFGAVYTKNSSSRAINLAAYTGLGTTDATNTSIANLGLHILPEGVTVTIIDAAKSNTAKDKVVAGAFGDIQTSKWIGNAFTDASKIDEDRDYAALIKYYDDEIVDVVIIKNLAK